MIKTKIVVIIAALILGVLGGIIAAQAMAISSKDAEIKQLTEDVASAEASTDIMRSNRDACNNVIDATMAALDKRTQELEAMEAELKQQIKRANATHAQNQARIDELLLNDPSKDAEAAKDMLTRYLSEGE